MKLKEIGSEVKVINGRQPMILIPGTIVGYALIQTVGGWMVSYVVRLAEGCDTISGFYMRTIAVSEGDLEP